MLRLFPSNKLSRRSSLKNQQIGAIAPLALVGLKYENQYLSRAEVGGCWVALEPGGDG
ncbi:hypothetical protein K9N68_17945 [Kovacikia minuta CCNUW1]|uniref:hypothetical protein n=1 Tax=Kovacikia minuta TaxID=2931930 RepID=UPI001CCF67B5|nr:hypothetical protein [Kovacikia minuta]UBF23654.1 hypothetical protein K9N68_17945 [Kovacikia minuta CCNUW1]